MNFVAKYLLLRNLGLNRLYGQTIQPLTTYKSALSLDKLYPSSNLNLSTPQKPPTDGDKFSGYIPIDKIQITYSKSTGPGGQNVNKINTKVDLRFHLESADWLSTNVRKALQSQLKTRITADGFLIFRSDVTRSQQLNLADCLNKLRCAIHKALEPEPVQSPETAERLRRRYEKAMENRLLRKRHRSLIKEGRRDLEF
ncbi:hypothetical protein RN001_014241 [Aquatica leii]|uniref:Large ribosomal subunit protein mL62 n=1 Tax=Aquatica leii TaxID=1421715 RepID=A0AAN7P5J6_9COLE|nr:hypothetical protein RN001_014241 [Aquatica leii]